MGAAANESRRLARLATAAGAALVLFLGLIVPGAATAAGNGADPGNASQNQQPTGPLTGDGRDYIVQFAPGSPGNAPEQAVDRAAASWRSLGGPAFDGALVRLTDKQADALARNPNITLVTPDVPMVLIDEAGREADGHPAPSGAGSTATGNPVEPAAVAASWGLDRTDQRDLPLDFQYNPPGHGDGVHVFVVDTGVSTALPDFAGRVGTGLGLIGGQSVGTADCHGHGTHVAGTVASTTYGMANQAIIHAVRVLDCSGIGYASDIIAALNWIAGQPYGQKVVNMSLSGTCGTAEAPVPCPPDNAVSATVENLIGTGAIVATSAGNKSGDACGYWPGNSPNALTVGATNIADEEAALSNYGACVDLYAPGINIISTNYQGGAPLVMSGTSMAAPHVAGAAAIYWDLAPCASGAEVSDAVLSQATTGVISWPSEQRGSPDLLANVEFAPTPCPPDSAAAAPLDGGARVWWAAPADGASPITSYEVTASPGGLTCTSSGATTCTVGGLANGTPHTFTVTASNANGTSAPSGPSNAVTPGVAIPTLVPQTPWRAADTRDGTGGVPIGLVAARGTLEVTVAGVNGVPADASAISANVTVTGGSSGGWAGVYPCGEPLPWASNLNYSAGETFPNAVISKIGDGGKICIYASGATHVVVDVNGYLPAGANYSSMVPWRAADTRDGTGAVPIGLVPGRSTLEVAVAGVNGVPADASAISANITVTRGISRGWAGVYPCGEPVPWASNLNYVAGQTIPNAVISKIGDGGKICIYATGATHIVVDVNGYLPAGTDYVPQTPWRAADTRDGTGGVAEGMVPARGTLEVAVAGVNGVPADASTISANVTVTGGTAGGWAGVYPCGEAIPWASNLNYVAGETFPNAVISKIGDGGKICIYVTGATHIVVDVNGYLP